MLLGTELTGLIRAWAASSAIGPPIGGALSEANWRWLFCEYLLIMDVKTLIAEMSLRYELAAQWAGLCQCGHLLEAQNSARYVQLQDEEDGLDVS